MIILNVAHELLKAKLINPNIFQHHIFWFRQFILLLKDNPKKQAVPIRYLKIAIKFVHQIFYKMAKISAIKSIAILLFSLSSVASRAQGITAPRVPSPAATVSQTIGIST